MNNRTPKLVEIYLEMVELTGKIVTDGGPDKHSVTDMFYRHANKNHIQTKLCAYTSNYFF